MSQADWDAASSAALQLFEFGQEIAASRGLLLVDTKYEFGRDADGNVLLIDEVHTPDSSRYWLADSYEERLAAAQVLFCCHGLAAGNGAPVRMAAAVTSQIVTMWLTSLTMLMLQA